MDKDTLDICIDRWGNSIKKYLENLNGRYVVVFGDDSYTLAISKTIKAMRFKFKCILSDTLKDPDIEIFPTQDMKNYSATQYFVLVASLVNHKIFYENLINRHYCLHIDFAIMGVGGYTKPIDAIDSLLGFSRLHDDIPGFKIWKSSSGSAFRIIILGNSTSDPTTGMVKSWSEILFEKLKNDGLDIEVYNGAVTGYCSTQEFLKLNRDVLTLSPDLVISFSGYNDILGTSSVEEFPYLHKYSKKFFDFLANNRRLAPDSMYMRNVSLISHGLQTIQPDYMNWIYNMRKMNEICKLYTAKFQAYFQPMLECESIFVDDVLNDIINEYYELSNISRNEVHDQNLIYSKRVSEAILNDHFIKNMKGIFENRKNVFYDVCHYSELGNKIIAERIYEDVLEILGDKRTTYEKKIN